MSSASKLINKIEVSFKVIKNQIFINSLDLAKVFNKRHNNIIRTIKDLPQDEFKTLNFKNKVYLDAQMKPRPCYNLTRDGFSLLVMGFTGQKAYKWKIEFIKAFNEMEKRLKNIEQENIKKLAYHQSLGYKSQLEQQKKKYENEIKALKYDMAKKQDMRDNLKRLSFEEIKYIRDYLKKEYSIHSFDDTDILLFAECVARDCGGRGQALIYKNIKKHLKKLSPSLEIVQAQGDSMLPYAKDNELLLIDKEQNFKNGEVVIFSYKDEVFIRQAFITPNDRKLSFVSKNPLYPSFSIEGKNIEKIRIKGVLRAKIKRF